MEKWSVKTTDDIIVDKGRILGREDETHIGGKVIFQRTAFEHIERVDGLVQDGALASPVHSAQDIHIGFEFPRNVLASPKPANLNSLDVIGLFLHNEDYLQRKKPMPKRSVAALSRSSLTLGSAMEISNLARSHNDLLRKYTIPCSVAMY